MRNTSHITTAVVFGALLASAATLAGCNSFMGNSDPTTGTVTNRGALGGPQTGRFNGPEELPGQPGAGARGVEGGRVGDNAVAP